MSFRPAPLADLPQNDLDREAIDVGFPSFETKALVKAVRSLARGPRGQIDGPCTFFTSKSDAAHREGCTNPEAASTNVYNDVLDNRTEAGRNPKHHKGEHTHCKSACLTRNQERSRR